MVSSTVIITDNPAVGNKCQNDCSMDHVGYYWIPCSQCRRNSHTEYALGKKKRKRRPENVFIIRLVSRLYWSDDMKSLETINLERFDIVSFDIYDTLLKRDVYKPSIVFYYVERKMVGEFYEHRIKAERLARNKTEEEEISIEEIYDLIPGTSSWKKEALEYEFRIEENICVTNQEVIKFLQLCKEKGKRII